MKNQLAEIMREESEFISLYNFIRSNQFVCSYINGKKYFFFAVSGQIYCISEFVLSFVIFTVSFFSVVGIRKLLKKFEIKNKIKRKFQKVLKKIKNRQCLDVRGGQNFENDILHYEVDRIEDEKISLPNLFFKLTYEERLVKAIVKKCLKANRFYKITNRPLLEIIDRMMEFQKKDNTRIISYDALILALLISAQPLSPMIYDGTIKLVQKLGYSAVAKYGPLIISLLIGIIGGFRVNLVLGNALISFFVTIPSWLGLYRVAEYGRNILALDCTDYVEELPIVEQNLLSEGSLSLEAKPNQNSKISVSSSKPTRHETFVSTAPDQELHYEQKVKIETLDGFYKQQTKLSGEKIWSWKPNQYVEKPQLTEVKYIPLHERTRTLADIQNLDSTRKRESVERIRDLIEKEQIALRIIDEFVE